MSYGTAPYLRRPGFRFASLPDVDVPENDPDLLAERAGEAIRQELLRTGAPTVIGLEDCSLGQVWTRADYVALGRAVVREFWPDGEITTNPDDYPG